jgi:cell division protein FtsB
MAKIGSAKLYIGIAIFLIIFVPPFAKYQELRYKNQKLAERIDALKAENMLLEQQKKSLETDIVYVEKRARDKMGLIRKGEIVMRGAPSKPAKK